MIPTTLITLAVLALSLVIAGFFIHKAKGGQGVVLGLLPIVVMEAVMQWSMDASIAACIDRACIAAGAEPGCAIAEFGCTEWSGVGRIIFWVAGFAAALLFAVGVVVMGLVRSRRRSKGAAESPPSHEGPAAAARKQGVGATSMIMLQIVP